MTNKSDWEGRVGESWAAEWQRTDRSFSQLTDRLCDRILSNEASRYIDVGCGAGELSLLIARARPASSVTGVDLSPALIKVARERGGRLENLTFEEADATAWASGHRKSYDCMVSRHGVMFFDNPVAAFSQLRGAMTIGGKLIFSCFRTFSDNPFFTEVGKLVGASSEVSDPLAPGPFAFSDSDYVRAILDQAGWADLSFERVDFQMIAGSGIDPVIDAVSYFSRIGPAARAIAELPEGARAAAREKLAVFASEHLEDGKVGLGASCWIVSASAR